MKSMYIIHSIAGAHALVPWSIHHCAFAVHAASPGRMSNLIIDASRYRRRALQSLLQMYTLWTVCADKCKWIAVARPCVAIYLALGAFKVHKLCLRAFCRSPQSHGAFAAASVVCVCVRVCFKSISLSLICYPIYLPLSSIYLAFRFISFDLFFQFLSHFDWRSTSHFMQLHIHVFIPNSANEVYLHMSWINDERWENLSICPPSFVFSNIFLSKFLAPFDKWMALIIH